MEITLAQLAVRLNGRLVGGGADTPVTGVAGYDTATEGDVTFVNDIRRLPEAEASPALAILVTEAITHSSKPLIIVQDPRLAFGQALRIFDWRCPPIPGIDPTAHIAKSAAIHAHAHIGPFVSVGEGAVIGDGCVIYAHAVIGDHVTVGPGTTLYPHVTIYPRCTLGSRVIVHAGAVIGADGHGYQPSAEGWEKIPHLGTVEIEDDVEIGANTAIDRATTNATRIGRGSKIDNLVHIAHNVQVGPHCMILGQAGIAGSTVVDDWVIIAGQSGIRDHAHIGAQARIVGRSGVTKDVPAGVTVSGYPAQPHLDELKFEAALRRVPELLAAMKGLQRRVAELEASLPTPAGD